MALAIREQIMVALLALVAGAVPTGWSVGRNPQRETTDSELPYAALIEGPHREVTRATQLRAYEMNVTIELAAAGEDAATDIVAAYAALTTAINAAVVAGTGIGALTVTCDEQGLGEFDRFAVEGHQLCLAAPLDLSIEFWTDQADPTALAP